MADTIDMLFEDALNESDVIDWSREIAAWRRMDPQQKTWVLHPTRTGNYLFGVLLADEQRWIYAELSGGLETIQTGVPLESVKAVLEFVETH